MHNLSKSKLLAFRQCPKRLWLEVHRPDLKEEPPAADDRFETANEVGVVARQLYDPNRLGTLIDVKAEGFKHALTRSMALLESSAPIFEAGFSAEGALAFADIMLPVGNEAKHSWRMVEVKSSTSIKDYHHDDIAIQAFIALAAGVPLKSIALAHIDGEWLYPGGGNYQGLLKENDLTNQAFERGDEIKDWIGKAQAVAQRPQEPQIRTGTQCSDPYECSFRAYCKSQEPQSEYPIEWLPRLMTKAVKDLIESNAVKDMRGVPDEYLDDLQRRVKEQTLSGEPFFNHSGAAAELARHEFPAIFLDFETVYFAVPIWRGTRPYQHIPYQFSRHELSSTGKLDHSEFLDLSGDDPSEGFAEALIAACGKVGPVFVYNAAFETTRIAELADRFPRLEAPLLAITERIVDLLPVTRRHYYHPSQHGSWSLKSVLPTIATDLSYDNLDGVQDGGMAMTVYLEAIQPETARARKDEIRRQLLNYCSLDTYALVRLWQYFASPKYSAAQVDLHQCNPANRSLDVASSGVISMAIPQPLLRSADAHVHILEARCPVCDQPIPDERVDQVRARFLALSEEQFAPERIRIQEQARQEAMKSADTELQQRINELTRENTQLQEAKKAQIAKEEQITSKVGALQNKIDELQRKIDEKTAGELGEGAETKLFEKLTEKFPGDKIRRVAKGTPGADIIHVVVQNGKECGTIVYDSKNRNAWQNNFVTKLREDQIAEKAEHAILSTCKFPKDVQQLAVQEGVIIANPARVLAIAEILRREIIHDHELQIVGEERGQKTEALYSYITSPTFSQHLDSIEIFTSKMNDLDAAEERAHKRIWRKRSGLIKSVQEAQGELRADVDQIIGTDDIEQ